MKYEETEHPETLNLLRILVDRIEQLSNAMKNTVRQARISVLLSVLELFRRSKDQDLDAGSIESDIEKALGYEMDKESELQLANWGVMYPS